MWLVIYMLKKRGRSGVGADGGGGGHGAFAFLRLGFLRLTRPGATLKEGIPLASNWVICA